MIRRGALLVCAIAALCVGVAAQGQGPPRFDPDRLADVLTPGSLAYLAIDDFSAARDHYLQMARARFWHDGPGRTLIRTWLRSEGDEELLAATEAFLDALKLLSGKVAFAFEDPALGDDMDMPGPILVADAGANAGGVVELLSRMLAEDVFVEEDPVEIEGIPFDQAADLLLGRIGSTVVAGTSGSVIRSMLVRAREKPWQSLANAQSFKMVCERTGDAKDYLFYMNYADMWRMLAQEMMEEEWAGIQTSGLAQLVAAGMGGRFTPQGAEERLTFLLRGRARGMWELLAPQPLERATWRQLPIETSGFVSYRVDFARRAKPFLQLLKTLDEDEYDAFVEPFEDFREATGISFAEDVLPLATGEVTWAFLAESDAAAEWHPQDKPLKLSFLAIQLADASRARGLMQKLASIMGDDDEPIAKRISIGDRSGWALDLTDDLPVYLFGEGDVAYVALRREPLEFQARSLARGGARLVDSPEFRRATAWLPRDTGFVGYSSVREEMKSVRKTIAAMGDDIEGRELPSLETCLKDITPMAAALRTDPLGFTFEMRSPHGFTSYFLQLEAHFYWRHFRELEVFNEKEARAQFAVVIAAAERAADDRSRFVILSRAAAELRGTRFYGRILRHLAPLQEEFVRPVFDEAMTDLKRLRGKEEKIERLQRALAAEGMAGSRFEGLIHAQLRALSPVDDVRIGGDAGGVAGSVLAVRPEVDLVMLSVGSDDGVTMDMVFEIERDGQFVGRVKVEKVFTDMCSARIITDAMTRIREGDDARSVSASEEPVMREPAEVF
jgi:hypothetical protein